MRLLLCLFATLLSLFGYTQKREETFDINFKPASSLVRYYVITEKKEQLWHRLAYYLPERTLAQEAWYLDDSCTKGQGTFLRFHTNKVLQTKGSYNNGVKQGIWLEYNEDGYLVDSSNYEGGHLSGVSLHWYPDGMLADSSNFDGKGNGSQVSFYEDGALSAAGLWMQDSLRRGKWKYYHPNGQLKATENYEHGQVADWTCFDAQGKQLDTALCRSRDADFAGGINGWRKFLERNLDPSVPLNKRAPLGEYMVMAQFIVEKDGSLSGLKTLTRYGYGMEEEVMRILKKSPKWMPAMQFGVPVRAYRKQPVTFYISQE